mgnify:FL=1
MFENQNERTYKAYIEGIDDYIEHLEKMNKVNPEAARKEAMESLIRSGILNSDGKPKKQICD